MKKFKLIKQKQKHIIQVLGLGFIDLIFFGLTNIKSVPSYVIMVGFLLMSLSVYAGVYYLLSIIKLYGLPIERKSRITLYVTSVIGVLLALQSIGELSAKDILVLLPLTIISYIYLGYVRANEQKIT